MAKFWNLTEKSYELNDLVRKKNKQRATNGGSLSVFFAYSRINFVCLSEGQERVLQCVGR